MILATVAMTAIVTQAASVSWKADAFYTPTSPSDGSFTETKVFSASKANPVTGYLWEVDAVTYATYAADTSLIYTEFSKGDTSALGTAMTTGTSKLDSKISLTGTTNYLEDDTAYAILLYTYKDVDGNHWYIANAAKYEGIGTNDANVGSLNAFVGGKIGTDAQGAAITGWSTVPEPTSGLLLLVGMGALALRRKQK